MALRPRSAAEFERVCCALDAGWSISRPKREAWLEKQVYELVSHLIEEDLLGFFEPRSLLLSKRGPPAKPNPFALGLRIIFVKSPKAQGTKARELMAVRLAHAYRHFVPIPFLSMFLGPTSRRPPTDSLILEDFETWVAYHHRWLQTCPDERGELSSQLHQKADRLRPDAFIHLQNLVPKALNDDDDWLNNFKSIEEDGGANDGNWMD